MGMEVREKEDAFGGLGFLASALGEGYFFCCCARDDLLELVELDMRGELAAEDDLDMLGLQSPLTLLLAEPILEPESVLGSSLGLGSGTFDFDALGLFLGLLPPAVTPAFRGDAPAVAEFTLRPVDPTPPRGVALADAVPGRFLALAAVDALCSSFMSVSSDSEDLIDGRRDSLLSRSRPFDAPSTADLPRGLSGVVDRDETT